MTHWPYDDTAHSSGFIHGYKQFLFFPPITYIFKRRYETKKKLVS